MAAMRVLGILPQDIQNVATLYSTHKGKDVKPAERPTIPEGLAGEVRQEAFETKRRQLMHSVYSLATDKSIDLSKSASEPAMGQTSGATNAFLAEVMAKEAASMAKMRKRSQADVQKIVIDEMASKKQVEIRNAKLEEHRKRMVEKKKEQDAEIKKTQIEAEKKKEKSRQVRIRNDQMIEKQSAELWKELVVKDDRVEALLNEREEGWETNRVTKQAERETKYDGIAVFKSKELGVREKMYAVIEKRTEDSETRLGEIQDEFQKHQAAKSDRTDGVITRARMALGQQQAEKDEAYIERLKVHDKKKEVREALAKERVQAFVTENKRWRTKFEKEGKPRAQKERESIPISPRMEKSMSGAFETSPAWQTDATLKAFETHHAMGELRQVNLQMLRRANQHQQMQALNKIKDMRHRVKAFRDSKEEAQDRRYDMMKNCAIEKHHLTFQVQKVRDAPPEKMNSLLEHMGLEPVRTGKEEGEEDADAKK